MRFNEIVHSARPLGQLVRLALSTKGVTVTDGTVDRYTGLLEAAILADDGDFRRGGGRAAHHKMLHQLALLARRNPALALVHRSHRRTSKRLLDTSVPNNIYH